MKDILQKLGAVYDLVVAKEADVSQRLVTLSNREAAVAIREQRATEFESAEATLAAAKAVQIANEQGKNDLIEEKAAFENYTRKERQAIADEYGRLQSLKDKEAILFRDQQALYAAQKQLDIDRAEYKSKIEKQVKEHFANTNGR